MQKTALEAAHKKEATQTPERIEITRKKGRGFNKSAA